MTRNLYWVRWRDTMNDSFDLLTVSTSAQEAIAHTVSYYEMDESYHGGMEADPTASIIPGIIIKDDTPDGAIAWGDIFETETTIDMDTIQWVDDDD